MIAENRFLSLSEMQENAQYIYDKLRLDGWSANAIFAILGNMQSESTINPGIWEGLDSSNTSGGFGLVQWTPSTKYTSWASANGYSSTDINGQIERIKYEVANGIQWISTSQYPMTFAEFKISELSPYDLAMVFINNYERPYDTNQPWRGEQATYWSTHLSNTPLTPPTTTKRRKLPVWIYCN